MAAAPYGFDVDLPERPHQPALDHQLRELQVTALERFSAAYAIAGLSVRMSRLAEVDRRDDETNPARPYVGAHRVA